MSNEKQAPPPGASTSLIQAVVALIKRHSPPYAQLGTVIQGEPTLTIELDGGQVIPQCVGPSDLVPGTRVIGWYINMGHDFAVLTIEPPGED